MQLSSLCADAIESAKTASAANCGRMKSRCTTGWQIALQCFICLVFCAGPSAGDHMLLCRGGGKLQTGSSAQEALIDIPLSLKAAKVVCPACRIINMIN